MDYFIDSVNLENYLILPKTFDWLLVDQEPGFQKIFEIVPRTVYGSLQESEEETDAEIYRLLTKAAVHYAFIFSIPKLKVHISNFGMQEFQQNNMKAAPWWDVRDLGLSLLKTADRLVSDALNLLAEHETLRPQIPFFAEASDIITTPAAFNEIFSINYSPEVYQKLQKFLQQALYLKIYDKIPEDCLDIVKEDPFLYTYLKSAVAFYALYYASLLPSFVFLQNAVVIQYEELPWQKSAVLSPEAKIYSGKNFLKLAAESLGVIIDHMKNHPADFPCYRTPEPNMKPKARDSGLSLLG